jgi:hypothetical protein
MAVDRAYMYFFDDKDEPSFHAASGITRNFQKKPSFYAMAHLYRSLGEYRFNRAVLKKAGEVYAYEYVHATDKKKKVLAVWSPTGSDREAYVDVPVGKAKLDHIEAMALDDGEPAFGGRPAKDGMVAVKLTESPLYLWLQE